jgi:lactoylglutathione lyase
MKISHIAIWTKDLECLKEFYTNYFNCVSGEKYCNQSKNFESYFLSFGEGAKIEIMNMPQIPNNFNDVYGQYIGINHFAISVGSREKVLELTEKMRDDEYRIIGEPRTTGDGFFESCVLDPDGNRIEITV